jgi:hypothetical protein
MPLRDHFRPPLSDRRDWDGFLGGWPAMITSGLNRTLPQRYVAGPRVRVSPWDRMNEAIDEDEGGWVATAIWAPPKPTLVVATDLPDVDEYEVLVHADTHRGRLVAAVEIVSPSNKDRPETRRAFVAKCAALLLEHVCIAIVDVVTTRDFNLYAELLGFIGLADPSLADGPPPIYAVACRLPRRGDAWLLETWAHPLTLGQPLPTLPLWLAENLAVPLELEPSYEETCRSLRIP